MSIPAKPWNADDEAFLRANYLTMTDGQIAKRLRRTTASVWKYRNANAIHRPMDRRQVRWTEEESKYVCENYKCMSDKKMAQYLKRTIDSVQLFRINRQLFKTKVNRMDLSPLDLPQQDPNSPLVLFQINKKLIADWYRVHGEKSYGDAPVNFRRILTSYQKAA
jgi:hypothetical protein